MKIRTALLAAVLAGTAALTTGCDDPCQGMKVTDEDRAALSGGNEISRDVLDEHGDEVECDLESPSTGWQRDVD